MCRIFVAPSPALVRSFGEVVRKVDSGGHLHAVLVLPDEVTNTGGVYRAFDEQDRRLIDESRVERLIGSASGGMPLFNDLSTPAYSLSPKLASIAAEVSRLVGRPAHLSGSGSAHFVVADDLQHACDLAGTIERQLDLPAIPVKTLDPDA